MAIDLSALSTREALSAVYIGYYDRAADVAGMQFWEQVVANTSLDLVAITSDFASQSETQEVHPFFADPATSSPATFITSLYQNLFNRDPDAAGLTFWSDALQDAIDGVPGAITVGEIIIAIIQGAVDVEGGTQDRTTILNKIEVATAWTDAAEAAGDEYGALSQASAKSIIEGVTDDPATVTAAKATVDDFFADDNGDNGGTPGEKMFLTSGTDVMTGTEDDDQFLGYIQQNPFAGGVSNSVSSADRLDGGAGDDRLYAELTYEFVGVNAIGVTDVQPRTNNIEDIDIEARDVSDFGFGMGIDLAQVSSPEEWVPDIVVDAKYMVDVEEIGSHYSDGDLKIENLTTLTSNGSARNTSEMTITMDHTDNFNTDEDASDLVVLFDNDYLLSGQESQGEIYYWILDEDAELAGNPNRLNNIDVDGLRFNITNADGTVTAVNLEAIEANLAGTHQGFVNALQPALQALIAAGTLPEGTTLTLDPTITDTTFLDDGTESDTIPAIVLTSGDGSEVVATGFSRIQEEIGEYDVYGRFDSFNEVQDEPISINIDLHKVGRGGDGGDLIIGGKSYETQDGIADGIEVFHINVLGAGNDDPNGGMAKPSSLGTVSSTGEELREVYIKTDAEYAQGDTFASLEIRNGFNQPWDGGGESGDLQLVNADAFLGDLALGTWDPIINLDTLTAQGGGDVTFYARLNGSEEGQAYSYTTGSGDDVIDLDLDGDAFDFAGSSLNVMTGAGDDLVKVDSDFTDGSSQFDPDNERLNQAILDNIEIDTGAGNDTIIMEASSMGNFNIDGGADADFIDTSGGETAAWAFNYDDARSGAQFNDLPGVPTTLAYVGGATVTVTLSGAGISNAVDGGGVMAYGGALPTTPGGAFNTENGYEASATVNVAGPNQYFGTQVDVNNAVIAAITNDPVLSKLIELELTENNTWIARTTVGGDFHPTDLKVEIKQNNPTSNPAAHWAAVEDEAQSVFSNSAIDISNLADANGDGTGVGFLQDLSDNTEVRDWYTGLSVGSTDSTVNTVNNSRQITDGDNSVIEQDNVINGGSNDAADDLIVLSTDEYNGQVLPTTWIPGNTLQNLASNETIVMEGNFGDDTIMNFTVMENGWQMPTAGRVNAASRDGLDFLDFTSYLTSQEDISDNSSPADSSDSNNPIPVTLDTDATDVEANEVSVVQFDNTDESSETFASLSASVIETLFNNGGSYDGFAGDDATFGNLDAGVFSANDEYQTDDQEELIGDAKSILMVENADNLGEYKVFELTWNGSEDADVDGLSDGVVSAVEIGSLDFGTSLNGEFNQLHEINLVGSDDYAYLIDNGFVN
ncbi:DUF4214 domain-containing protein [Sulfitobacter sp. JBTF-M27]|uniref:DUF4214 domain-containing protein n=1 Tax=Sulfitobacter sediminilitoris TaxID=2698830 RepID=A0A6P0CF41_9RHOB|nr:DUF4214 domain-containing protein [Sulfitobacter sediminilitoris]NEK24789.1 DUF4214 domain-containing protein [Sulfitobacter sediminilitoris]